MNEKMTWVYFKLGWNATNYDIIHKGAIPLKKGTRVSALPSVCSCSSVCCACSHSGRSNQPAERTWSQKKRFQCEAHIVSRGTLIFLPFVTLCIQVGLLQSQLGLLQTCNTPAKNKPQPTLMMEKIYRPFHHTSWRIIGIAVFHTAPILMSAALQLSWTLPIYRCWSN